MAKASLFEKLEKEHQTLLDKIDDLDRKITEVLRDWSQTDDQHSSDDNLVIETELSQSQTD